MSDSDEVENNGIDGEDPMGSLNHSTVQFKLGSLLDRCAGNKLHFATSFTHSRDFFQLIPIPLWC